MKDCEATRGPNDWDLDFSYDLLRALYSLILESRRPALLGDAREELAKGGPVVFVRHDLDVSVARARGLAEFEAGEAGLKSTYHVMTKSPFYTPASAKADLAAIAGHGHELGLHFDATGVAADALVAAIDLECKKLEDVLGSAVRSVSFHIPPPDKPTTLTLGGRVNGYGKEIATFYLSDSCGRWREGDPRLSVVKPRGDVMQILVHPVWWGREHVAPPLRLGAFVSEVAAEKSISWDEACELVYQHILYRAARVAA